jgi:hypothetical protein
MTLTKVHRIYVHMSTLYHTIHKHAFYTVAVICGLSEAAIIGVTMAYDVEVTISTVVVVIVSTSVLSIFRYGYTMSTTT